MRQRTTEQLQYIVEKMQALMTERDELAHRSKMARIDGNFVKREVADGRIAVIDRKLGWYRGRIPSEMHPPAVVALWEAKDALKAEREAKAKAEREAQAADESTVDETRDSEAVDIESLEDEAIADAVVATETAEAQSAAAIADPRVDADNLEETAIDEEAEEAAAFKVVVRTTKSGVRVSDDFRDNLIIDRYDQVFATMRGLKLRHLRSENSEDAVTWNVFRSLRQIDPAVWLPKLARRGLQGAEPPPAVGTVLSLWLSVSPPPALLIGGDEGNSEIDVAIEGPSWVWFIEAKYRSDIETRTKTRPGRDQVLRNIDVGSYYPGTRDFFFSLLVVSPETSPLGAAAVAEYSDFSETRALLQAHRSDRLTNLRAVTLLTWSDMAAVLTDARDSVVRVDEQHYADRALEWMQVKGLVG